MNVQSLHGATMGDRHLARQEDIVVGRLVIALGVVTMLTACPSDRDFGPCGTGAPGHLYEFPLLEEYSGSSTLLPFESALARDGFPTCGDLDGLKTGSSLRVTVLDRKSRVSLERGSFCDLNHIALDSPPDGWELMGAGTGAVDSIPLFGQGHWNATKGACGGDWDLALTLFPTAAPAEAFVSVHRKFRTERAEDCPLFALEGKTGLALCDDQWVSRQPIQMSAPP